MISYYLYLLFMCYMCVYMFVCIHLVKGGTYVQKWGGMHARVSVCLCMCMCVCFQNFVHICNAYTYNLLIYPWYFYIIIELKPEYWLPQGPLVWCNPLQGQHKERVSHEDPLRFRADLLKGLSRDFLHPLRSEDDSKSLWPLLFVSRILENYPSPWT